MTTIPGKNILLTGESRGLGPVMAEALACSECNREWRVEDTGLGDRINGWGGID